LRAYREEQRRAWGDVDNTTLGRYLAGEISPDEREQVEQALEELPELRRLTDLVRDVLEDYEPATASPPAVIPFVAPPPFREQKRSRRLQYASLALAASVLLTFGVALPQSGMLAQVLDLPASTATFASREPIGLLADGEERLVAFSQPVDGMSGRDDPLAGMKFLNVSAKATPRDEHEKKEDRHPDVLPPMTEPSRLPGGPPSVGENVFPPREFDGKDRKAEQQTVLVLNRQAEVWRRHGDLKQAASTYSYAHQMCMRAYGPGHPETRRTRNNLAQVYESALNTPVEPAYANPYTPDVVMVPPAPPQPQPGGHHVYQARKAHRPLQEELLECSPAQLKTDVVPVLVESLREARTSEERQHLALALGRLGPAARPAVPVLVETLQKQATQPEERSVLLTTLGQIGPGARQALPVLVSSVCDDAPQAREAAVYALKQMGPAARGVVGDLIKPGMANDPQLRDVLRHIRGRDGRIGVLDESECFSAAALTQARDSIRSLAQNSDVEVLVETVATLPPASTERAANDLGSRGIHVVIGKDDRSVRVRVAPALQQQGITLVSLARSFAGPLRQKNFDASLRAGIRFVARVETPRTPARR
jgi:hypothetical protein